MSKLPPGAAGGSTDTDGAREGGGGGGGTIFQSRTYKTSLWGINHHGNSHVCSSPLDGQ